MVKDDSFFAEEDFEQLDNVLKANVDIANVNMGERNRFSNR